jgi:DNA polymerase-1
MLVSKKNLSECVAAIVKHAEIAVDTETTGLMPFHGDRLFSLIIATDEESYYFNFNAYEGLAPDLLLDKKDTLALLQRDIFCREDLTVVMHNAKFDLHMLSMDGVRVSCRVVDTEVLARLRYNRHLTYSLSSLAKTVGMEKSDAVEEYLSKHKLSEKVAIPGKKKKVEKKRYDKVPFEIVSEYGAQDGRVTMAVYRDLVKGLAEVSSTLSRGKLCAVVENETRLIKPCQKMERQGILVDIPYCKEALAFEEDRAARAVAEFESITGQPFKDSNKELAKVFDAVGETYPKTEKGRPSFTAEVLEGFSSPLARLLLEYRNAHKRAGTYFSSYLYYADATHRIHPNIRQAGTDTGRFSVTDPNCQNLVKEDDSQFPIRRCFIPSDEFIYAMIDYDQMEYRLLLDVAGETEVIRKILDDGLDVHEATANLMRVDRKRAKTLNFMLLYGGGKDKLAHALGITVREAEDLKRLYFSSLPRVADLTTRIKETAETRGSIFNWMGRVCFFPLLMNPRTGKLDRFGYKAPNHYIQGGCADVVKLAMVRCDELLESRQARTRMLLNIHDELLFEVHKSELELIPELQGIMGSAYPFKRLPLTCSPKISAKSWFDAVDFTPENIRKIM